MPRKKITDKSLVVTAYFRVRENEHQDSNYIKSDYSLSQSASVDNIDTDRFMNMCYLSLGVKRTTAERYLRKFRAIDRRRVKDEKPFASHWELQNS